MANRFPEKVMRSQLAVASFVLVVPGGWFSPKTNWECSSSTLHCQSAAWRRIRSRGTCLKWSVNACVRRPPAGSRVQGHAEVKPIPLENSSIPDSHPQYVEKISSTSSDNNGGVDPVREIANTTSSRYSGPRSGLGRMVVQDFVQLRGQLSRTVESISLRFVALVQGAITIGMHALGPGWTPLRVFKWQQVVGDKSMSQDQVDQLTAVQRMEREQAVRSQSRAYTSSAAVNVINFVARSMKELTTPLRQSITRHSNALHDLGLFQMFSAAGRLSILQGAGRGRMSDPSRTGFRPENPLCSPSPSPISTHPSFSRPSSTSPRVPLAVAVPPSQRRCSFESRGDLVTNRCVTCLVEKPAEGAGDDGLPLTSFPKSGWTVDSLWRKTYYWPAGLALLSASVVFCAATSVSGVIVTTGTAATVLIAAAAAATATASSLPSQQISIQKRGLIPRVGRSRAVRLIEQALNHVGLEPANNVEIFKCHRPFAFDDGSSYANTSIWSVRIPTPSKNRDETVGLDNIDFRCGETADAEAKAVVLSDEPGIVSVPLIGRLLMFVDGCAYSIESFVGRIVGRLGLGGLLIRSSRPGGGLSWQLLQTLSRHVPE